MPIIVPVSYEDYLFNDFQPNLLGQLGTGLASVEGTELFVLLLDFLGGRGQMLVPVEGVRLKLEHFLGDGQGDGGSVLGLEEEREDGLAAAWGLAGVELEFLAFDVAIHGREFSLLVLFGHISFLK